MLYLVSPFICSLVRPLPRALFSAPLLTGSLKLLCSCTVMAFGSGSRKRRRSEAEDDEAGEDMVDASASAGADAGEEEVIELEDEEEEEEQPCQAQAGGKINPLFAEITMLPGEKGKNDGGSKSWRCNHCKKAWKSSLTRIRVHLLGPQPGKKAQITRCSVLQNDAAKTRELRDKVNNFLCTDFVRFRDSFFQKKMVCTDLEHVLKLVSLDLDNLTVRLYCWLQRFYILFPLVSMQVAII